MIDRLEPPATAPPALPTDVISGALAGSGIGLLVCHLHRLNPVRPVWIAVTPAGDGGSGGTVAVAGRF